MGGAAGGVANERPPSNSPSTSLRTEAAFFLLPMADSSSVRLKLPNALFATKGSWGGGVFVGTGGGATEGSFGGGEFTEAEGGAIEGSLGGGALAGVGGVASCRPRAPVTVEVGVVSV